MYNFYIASVTLIQTEVPTSTGRIKKLFETYNLTITQNVFFQYFIKCMKYNYITITFMIYFNNMFGTLKTFLFVRYKRFTFL